MVELKSSDWETIKKMCEDSIKRGLIQMALDKEQLNYIERQIEILKYAEEEAAANALLGEIKDAKVD